MEGVRCRRKRKKGRGLRERGWGVGEEMGKRSRRRRRKNKMEEEMRRSSTNRFQSVWLFSQSSTMRRTYGKKRKREEEEKQECREAWTDPEHAKGIIPSCFSAPAPTTDRCRQNNVNPLLL